MGDQLDAGNDSFGAAVLSGMGLRDTGGKSRAVLETTPIQQKLSLPKHLTRTPEKVDFAHPTEADLARIFSFYRVRWVYEPTTFHLECDASGKPTEQVCPDFYLPDYDIYVELTTMRQSLVTRKNRKIRRLKEAFPTLHVKLLYRKDYERLMGSLASSNGVTGALVPGKPIVSAKQLQQRIDSIAAELANAAAGKRRDDLRWHRQRVNGSNGFHSAASNGHRNSDNLRLVGLGAGSMRFLESLEAGIAANEGQVSTDWMALTQPVGGGPDERVRVQHRPSLSVDGRDVILVTDVVSTGMSAAYASSWLQRNGARSVLLCSLFDRVDARILDVQIEWSGFQAPNDVLVGYGISYHDQYDELPAVSPLRTPRTRSLTPKQEHPDGAQ